MTPPEPSLLNLDHVRAEIEDLRARAAAAGCGKLAFFLTCARIVTDRQIRRAEGGALGAEFDERWDPIGS